MLNGVVPPLIVVMAGLALAAFRAWRRSAHGWSDLGDVAICMAVIAVAIGLELEMGRSPTYRQGPVRLWSGDINSDQNSQQVLDPYSFTHVIHGAGLYGLTRLLPGAPAFGPTATAVLTVEAAWEAYENTDQVINRYRAETVSLGYYGDSALNSVSDIVTCLAGLVLAWRRRWWVTLSWVIAVELVLAYSIHDSLALNIIMLISPVEAIKRWQMGM